MSSIVITITVVKVLLSPNESCLIIVNEITQDVYQNFVPHWNGRYLTSNVYIKDVNNNKTVPIGLVIRTRVLRGGPELTMIM